LLGFAPFDVSKSGPSIDSLVFVVVIDLVLSAVAIVKGKPVLGLVGIFIPLVSIVAGLRLASPGSPWARRFYRPGSRRLARAERRWGRIRARRRRISDTVAGAPDVTAIGARQPDR
jgi:hypothetical protein